MKSIVVKNCHFNCLKGKYFSTSCLNRAISSQTASSTVINKSGSNQQKSSGRQGNFKNTNNSVSGKLSKNVQKGVNVAKGSSALKGAKDTKETFPNALKNVLEKPKKSNNSALTATFKKINASHIQQKAREFQKMYPDRYTMTVKAGKIANIHDFKWDTIRKANTKRDKVAPPDFSNTDLMDLVKNPALLSTFMTSSGRILHSDILGTNTKTQKKISKAIKRARAAGLVSFVHLDNSLLSNRFM